MATSNQNLSRFSKEGLPDVAECKFGIVTAEWNAEITHHLYQGCRETLIAQGVGEENIFSASVPGSFELPCGAQLLVENIDNLDAVICIGCIIKGETKHDEYIGNAVAKGIMQLGIDCKMPIIFGVLTPNNIGQARDRAGGKQGNKGVEAAISAIKMVGLKKNLRCLK